jgi:hypothetical protein
MQFSRRELLQQASSGFGAVALAALMSDWARGSYAQHGPHHRAIAKNIIFLYMDGGPSQVDTFDPKPLLAKFHGEDPSRLFKVAPTQFDDNGTVLASPWKFRQYGQSGIPISSLFPNIARCADELAVVRSMTSNFSEHTFANYFLHTGSGFQGRPSMGAWTTYGMGSESQDLPGYVVLNGGLIPPGGLDCFGSGFLPATYQGSIFRPQGEALANIRSSDTSPIAQRKKLNLVAELDQAVVDARGRHDAVEAAIQNYELAYRMQSAVPKLTDLSQESQATHRLYGLDSKCEAASIYAAECLMARRLVERGVRFIELTCPNVGHDRWDQHSELKKGHEDNAQAVDQPIAALLVDLKQRGLLNETLVVWAGEFGRTPFAQGANGRDHNPFGFSIWLAGGGIRGGTIYGQTDEWGYHAVDGRAEIHDLHATMLHLLGVDHERSTYHFGGRDMRLTDVHGHVMYGILE